MRETTNLPYIFLHTISTSSSDCPTLPPRPAPNTSPPRHRRVPPWLPLGRQTPQLTYL